MADFTKGLPGAPKEDIKEYDESIGKTPDIFGPAIQKAFEVSPEGQQQLRDESLLQEQSAEYLQAVEDESPEERERRLSVQAGEAIRKRTDPILSTLDLDYGQQLPFDPSDVDAPGYEIAGRSAISSVGGFIQGIGDMNTFLVSSNPITSWTLKYGDPVGDTFRALGEPWADRRVNYVPQSLEKFTWDDLMNPRFWTQEIAQVLPDAVGMFLGGAGLAKLGVRGLNKVARKAIQKGYITPGVGAAGVTIKKGRGLFGKLAVTPGGVTEGAGLMGNVLTQGGQAVGYGVLGGSAMNMLDGARVAGNGYNEAIQQGFDNNAAGDIAWNIWVDNSKWIGIDMLSFGVAYAGLGSGLMRKVIGKNITRKTGVFGVRTTNTFKNVATAAPIAAFEGTEEFFQENYQDWAVQKNFAEAKGERFMDYWDYLETEDAKKTGAISFVVGALMGGTVSMINQRAERNRKIDNREDIINAIYNDENLDEVQKKLKIIDIVAANAFATGRGAEVKQYLDTLLKEGKIDEINHANYVKHLETAADVVANTPFAEDMTDEVKEQYYLRSLDNENLKANINQIDEALNENLSRIDKLPGMTKDQKNEAKEIAKNEADAAKEIVKEEIAENERVQAAIINSVITEKGQDQRTRYRAGVKETAETIMGKEEKAVRPGTYAGETIPQLTEKEKERYTKEGQEAALNSEYRKRAIANLEEAGIETTRDNILQEMKRIKGTRQGFGIRKAIAGLFKAGVKGVKSIPKVGKAVVKGVRAGVKGVRAGVKGVTAVTSRAIEGVSSIIRGDTTIGEVLGKLAKGSGKVAGSVFSNIKTFAKQFVGKPIYKEDGTPTDQKFVDTLMKKLEEATGDPYTKMNAEDTRNFIEQFFPGFSIENVKGMTKKEFQEYFEKKAKEIEELQKKEAKEAKAKTPQQKAREETTLKKEAKAKEDKDKTPQQRMKDHMKETRRGFGKAFIIMFAEKMADSPGFEQTAEERQFYENNKKAIEEELKKIQKKREEKAPKEAKAKKEKQRISDDSVPVKTEEFIVTTGAGIVLTYKATTYLDGGVEWTVKGENDTIFKPAKVADRSIMQRDNISPRQALKVFEKAGDTVEVGPVGDYKTIMRDAKWNALTQEQKERVDPKRAKLEAKEAKKKVKIEPSSEEKQAKKRKKKISPKKKRKKRDDPFGRKTLKVKSKSVQTPDQNIDRFQAFIDKVALGQALRYYRDKQIDSTVIVVLSELSESIPSYALGQALGGAVFIRPSAWQETLAHEYGGHVFYRAYKHTKPVKDGIKNIMGTDLWEDTKNLYYNLTMFKFKNPVNEEVNDMTIEDISRTIASLIDDRRTKMSKSEEAEYRNVREAMFDLVDAVKSGSRQRWIESLRRLEIQLKAAKMISDINDNKQEALKEEVWARSTEANSESIVKQLLGIKKTEKHETYAKRFWNRVKRHFGKEEVSIPLLKKLNPSVKDIDDLKTIQDNLSNIVETETARPTINTYSSSASYMLRRDLEEQFSKYNTSTIRPWISSVFNDLSEMSRKKSKTLGEIAKDETKLEKYINDSFKKLGFNFNHEAWGPDAMGILKNFIKPMAQYHAMTADPNFKLKVRELTIMDWFEDLSSRGLRSGINISEELLNETSGKVLTEQDWLIKGKEMIDDFMIRQGMDSDEFLENMEGDGKIDYESRKGEKQAVSLTVQRLIKRFVQERYSQIRKEVKKVGKDEVQMERYESTRKALRNAKVLQGDLLLAGISSRYDAYTFINILRSSENVQTAEFINWLENTFGSREKADAFLMMMHKEFSDRVQETFIGVTQTEDSTGSKEFITRQLFSFHEDNLVTNIDNMMESFYGKKHKKEIINKRRVDQILPIVKELNKGLTNNTSVSILKMLVRNVSYARDYIDWTNVSFNGVTIDGRSMSIKNATEKILKKALFKRGGDYFIRSSDIKPLIEQLVVRSRKKNYVTLINNIEGKQTNISNKSSYLTRKIDTINEMFKRKEDETVEEYSERVDKLLDGNEYNIFTFLAAHEQEVQVALMSGMDSEVNNQAAVYERMSGVELLVADMSNFFESYNKGENGSYFVPIAVFAEKSRRYMIKGLLLTDKNQLKKQIEKLDYLKDKKYKDQEGAPVFPILKEDGTFNQKWLTKSVNKMKKYIENNSTVFKNKIFKNIVNPKTGKLKKTSTKHLELMIMNYIFNRVQAQRLLIGRQENYENVTDYSKRAAGAIARHIPFDKNINMDVVMFEDIYKTEDGRFLSATEAENEFGRGYKDLLVLVTDGAMYVTEDQAEEIKSSYGVLNDYGNHFKFVYNGSNQNYILPLDKDTTTETMYLKGNTFVLTDEAVKDSVYLQNIKKLLESRNSYFGKQDYTKGDVRYNNMFTIAAADSAIKTTYNKGDLLHSISGQENMTNFNEIHSIQEENYSDGINYTGMDGANFGVQLILDTEEKTAPLSVQLFSNIMINGNKHRDKVNSILDYFARSMKAKSNERVKKLKATNKTDATRVSRNIMQSIGEWAGASNNSLAKIASPLFPKNNIIKNSLGGNALSQTGARIYLDQLSERHGAGVRAYQSAEGSNLLAYSDIKTRSGKTVFGSEFIAPDSLKKLGYRVGDIIIGTRIPGKSKADHAVLVIKDFHSEKEGAKITIPSEISEVIGSDHDGDAVYLSGRYRDLAATTARYRMPLSAKLYNRGFDSLVDLLQETDFRENEIKKPINIRESSERAIRDAESNLGIKISKEVEMNTPLGDMEIFDNNIPARGLIGIITNLARDMHYLSYHNVGIKTSININGSIVDEFNNDNPDNYFPVAQSQNVALDNAKYLFANNLGMNKNTVKSFIILQRLGFTTGDIATIMNSEAAKLYNKHVGLKMVTQKSSEKISIDPSLKALYEIKNKGRNVEDDLVNPIESQEAWEKINFEYKEILSTNIDDEITIDFKDIKNNPDKFNLQVLKLLYYTNNLSKEIQSLSNLLGIYKRYPKDSFSARKIQDDISKLLDESSLFEKSSMQELLVNPIIKRNLEVLQEINDQYQNTNIVDSQEAQNINEMLEDYTDEKNPMGYHPRVARNYGLIKMENNISFLKDLKTKEELLEIIKEARISDPLSIVLHEAISLQGERNYETNKYEVNTIRINKNYIHEYTSEEIINDYRDSFSKLPKNIQRAIIQLDYIDNGWAGGTTSYIWSSEIWDQLNPELEALRRRVNDKPLSENHLRDIALEIIKNQYRLMPRTTKAGSLTPSGKNWRYIPGKKQSKILELQNSDIKHYIKHWDQGMEKYIRMEYVGNQRYKTIDEISKRFKGIGLEEKKEGIREEMEKLKKRGPKKIGDMRSYLDQWREGSLMLRPSYRVNVSDYINPDFFKTLSLDEWLKRKKIDKSKIIKGSDTDVEIRQRYNQYLDGMKRAQSLYYDLSDRANMDKVTNEQLIDLAIEFNNPKRFEQEVSKVMEGLISVELANRAALSQSKINKKGPKTAGLKDISAIKMWLISNNMPSDHPAVQSLIKQMEEHHRKYVQSYTVHVKKLARSERDLDRYMTSKYGWPTKLKLLFQNKWAETKYANLIKTVSKVDGQYIELVDEQTLRKNNVSDQEIEFHKEFKAVMEKFDKKRAGYIPHLMMGNYESLMKRGMFGLYNSNLSNTDKINDVMVDGLGPTGKEIRTFGEWRRIYEKGEFMKGGRKIKELEAIRKRAIAYLEKGVDANGNEIGLSLTETKALLGSRLFKDFAGSKQVRMAELGSKDLGKIGRLFVRSSVFGNGDVGVDNSIGFTGMQRMAPLVDGLIRVYKDNNNPRMAKYIEEVWRDGYLQNKKQVTFGKVGDKIVDFIIKHTLYIALGFGIIPAIGNVLIGKYNQVRAKGGKEFVTGEKRFWDPKTFKRNQLIIDQVMKHEYNVFDDIYSVNERSWIDKLVFWPMNASEKWIQGAAFLGTFTEAELNQFKFDGDGILISSPISEQEIIKRYDRIKREQGRGFSPVDQRLMGMYSWGRALLQFTRWLPTLVNERFGKEQIDRFGEMEIGSYTASADFGRDMIMGRKTFKDFKNLPEHRQEAIRKWFRGAKLAMAVGILAVLVGGAEGDEKNQVDKLNDDIMIFTDYDRLKWTVTPAITFTAANYINGFGNVLTQERSERPGKYLDTGDKKWKSNLYKSLPSPLVPERDIRMR